MNALCGRRLGSVLALLCFFVGIQQNLAAVSADDPLWLRYVAAMERIRDFECSYQEQGRPMLGRGLIPEYGAESAGDGFYVAADFLVYRWNLRTNHFYFEKKWYFGNQLPPYDRISNVVFHSDHGNGFFCEEQFSGMKTIRPAMGGNPVAHPVGFITGGMVTDPSEMTSRELWDIESIGENVLKLESAKKNRRIVLELDAAHGWVPRRSLVSSLREPNRHRELIVERFHQVDGIWLPVQMRSSRYDPGLFGPVLRPEFVIRLQVDPASIKVNQGMGPGAFRFTFPEGSIWRDEVTGTLHEGEIGKQRQATYRSQLQYRQNQKVAAGSIFSNWFSVAAIISLLGFVILLAIRFTKRWRTPAAGLVLAMLLL